MRLAYPTATPGTGIPALSLRQPVTGCGTMPNSLVAGADLRLASLHRGTHCCDWPATDNSAQGSYSVSAYDFTKRLRTARLLPALAKCGSMSTALNLHAFDQTTADCCRSDPHGSSGLRAGIRMVATTEPDMPAPNDRIYSANPHVFGTNVRRF